MGEVIPDMYSEEILCKFSFPQKGHRAVNEKRSERGARRA
jgi:hypothetical protein